MILIPVNRNGAYYRGFDSNDFGISSVIVLKMVVPAAMMS